MELNSFDRILAMSQSHYQSVRRRRRHLEYIRQASLVDDKGVIPGRFESVRQATKDRGRVVTDLGGFAVHQSFGANDPPAEGFANRLVSKTNAQYRKLTSKFADHCEGCARVPGD